MTHINPLEDSLSACCGGEHDINAEHSILNERAVGCCSICGRYAEFLPSEDFDDQQTRHAKIFRTYRKNSLDTLNANL
jgi:hypothetical protein